MSRVCAELGMLEQAPQVHSHADLRDELAIEMKEHRSLRFGLRARPGVPGAAEPTDDG